MNKIMKKKQSIGKRVPCFWDYDDYVDGGDADAIAAVAEILIQLPELILRARQSSSLVWGAKRRRSAIAGAGTKSFGGGGAISPATPLMFSPSESDDKTNNNNTTSCVSPVSKRMNKEELMQSLTDLTHQKHSLVKEMEVAKRHLEVLRASNLELKRRKQVIIYGISQPSIQRLHQQLQQIHYPFQMQQQPSSQRSTLSSVPGINKVEPVVLPDLNLTLEEAASNVDGLVGIGNGGYRASDVTTMVMDYNTNSRALASAQARKMRMQIHKVKNQNRVPRLR